jgi:hypothetical protein
MKNGILEIGSAVESKFIGVQSVVAFENKLYVLDTRSPCPAYPSPLSLI